MYPALLVLSPPPPFYFAVFWGSCGCVLGVLLYSVVVWSLVMVEGRGGCGEETCVLKNVLV